jgi:hypothetical protein
MQILLAAGANILGQLNALFGGGNEFSKQLG